VLLAKVSPTFIPLQKIRLCFIGKEATPLSQIQTSVSDERVGDEANEIPSLFAGSSRSKPHNYHPQQRRRDNELVNSRESSSSSAEDGTAADDHWTNTNLWPWVIGAALVIISLIILLVVLSRRSSNSRKKQMSDLDILDNYKQGFN
jgi:hypothetical protein